MIRQIKQMDIKQIRAFPKQSLHQVQKKLMGSEETAKKKEARSGKETGNNRRTGQRIPDASGTMDEAKDALEILNEDMPWRIREWLYVCRYPDETTRGKKAVQDIHFSQTKFRIGKAPNGYLLDGANRLAMNR